MPVSFYEVASGLQYANERKNKKVGRSYGESMQRSKPLFDGTEGSVSSDDGGGEGADSDDAGSRSSPRRMASSSSILRSTAGGKRMMAIGGGGGFTKNIKAKGPTPHSGKKKSSRNNDSHNKHSKETAEQSSGDCWVAHRFSTLKPTDQLRSKEEMLRHVEGRGHMLHVHFFVDPSISAHFTSPSSPVQAGGGGTGTLLPPTLGSTSIPPLGGGGRGGGCTANTSSYAKWNKTTTTTSSSSVENYSSIFSVMSGESIPPAILGSTEATNVDARQAGTKCIGVDMYDAKRDVSSQITAQLDTLQRDWNSMNFGSKPPTTALSSGLVNAASGGDLDDEVNGVGQGSRQLQQQYQQQLARQSNNKTALALTVPSGATTNALTGRFLRHWLKLRSEISEDTRIHRDSMYHRFFPQKRRERGDYHGGSTSSYTTITENGGDGKEPPPSSHQEGGGDELEEHVDGEREEEEEEEGPTPEELYMQLLEEQEFHRQQQATEAADAFHNDADSVYGESSTSAHRRRTAIAEGRALELRELQTIFEDAHVGISDVTGNLIYPLKRLVRNKKRWPVHVPPAVATGAAVVGSSLSPRGGRLSPKGSPRLAGGSSSTSTSKDPAAVEAALMLLKRQQHEITLAQVEELANESLKNSAEEAHLLFGQNSIVTILGSKAFPARSTNGAGLPSWGPLPVKDGEEPQSPLGGTTTATTATMFSATATTMSETIGGAQHHPLNRIQSSHRFPKSPQPSANPDQWGQQCLAPPYYFTVYIPPSVLEVRQLLNKEERARHELQTLIDVVWMHSFSAPYWRVFLQEDRHRRQSWILEQAHERHVLHKKFFQETQEAERRSLENMETKTRWTSLLLGETVERQEVLHLEGERMQLALAVYHRRLAIAEIEQHGFDCIWREASRAHMSHHCAATCREAAVRFEEEGEALLLTGWRERLKLMDASVRLMLRNKSFFS